MKHITELTLENGSVTFERRDTETRNRTHKTRTPTPASLKRLGAVIERWQHNKWAWVSMTNYPEIIIDVSG